MFNLISLFLIIAVFAVNQAVDYNNQEVSYILTEEPPSLDGMVASDVNGLFVLGHVKEGLLTYSPRGRITVGVAKSYKITDKGAIFYLRQGNF